MYYDKVIATDASEAQIANATFHPSVEYRCALAENSGLLSNSVDLIVAAQAAHWFNLPLFYEEARRVAKDDALIVLVCYGLMNINLPVDSLIRHFYHEILDDYWPPERRLLEEQYRNIPFPFRELIFPKLEIIKEWTLPELLAYMRTWSAVKLLINDGKAHALKDFEKKLEEAWSPQVLKTVRWPLSGRIGIIDRNQQTDLRA
jgi:hypothetical protein